MTVFIEEPRNLCKHKLARLRTLKPFRVQKPFEETLAYAEQRIHRRIAKYGRAAPITKAEREVLVKLVNLQLHHRGKSGFFERTVPALAKSVDRTERTVFSCIKRLAGLGILRVLERGLGRGNKAKYAVDLDRMREVMWPTFAVKIAGEAVRISSLIKGEILPPALKVYTLGKVAGGLSLGRGFGFDALQSLAARFRSLRKATWPAITRRTSLILGCGFDPETGEVFS